MLLSPGSTHYIVEKKTFFWLFLLKESVLNPFLKDDIRLSEWF